MTPRERLFGVLTALLFAGTVVVNVLIAVTHADLAWVAADWFVFLGLVAALYYGLPT